MTSHTVKQWLQEFPAMRERKERNRWLGALIIKKYGIELTPQLKDNIGDIMADFESGSRMWRKVLEENPELRGNDYGDGERLSQEYQLGIGYEVGFRQDVAK